MACVVAIGVMASASSVVVAQASAAVSPELQEVSRLVRAGQYNEAIAKANAILATRPKDALARFLKGVALSETGKTNDAIATFQSITEDHPELPEPYNNLAVLYASKGQFEKARTALELAIQTHPSYATAHENLGDVYAKLASQAYDRALQLDKGNTSVQTKLSLIRDLFSTQPKASQRPDATKVAAMNKAPEPVVSAAPVPKAPETVTIARVTPPPSAPAPAPAASSVPTAQSGPLATPIAPAPAGSTTPKAAVATAAATAPTAAAAPVATSLPANAASATASSAANAPSASEQKKGVLAAVKNWAKEWSNRNADGYLAFYSTDFKPEDGRSRRAWEVERRERVSSPSFIRVQVIDPVVILTNDTTAEVKFRQIYNSDRLKNHSVRKTLTLVKGNAGWQITRERNG